MKNLPNTPLSTQVFPSFDDICKKFSLGLLLHLPQEIPGGGLHRLWRIKTTQGEFAVKLFNSAVKKLQGHKILSYEQSQQIAMQMQAHRIPTVTAIPVKNKALPKPHYVLKVDSFYMMVFPWMTDSHSCSQDTAITTTHAAGIGHLLAQMHNLRLPPGQFKPPLWGVYSLAQWQRLISQINQSQITELAFLRHRLSWLAHLSAQAKQALATLNEDLVLSHRDLNPQNVLWQDDTTAFLIDWEYAGPINPQLERLIVAFNWSGFTRECPKKSLFQEVMTNYDAQVETSSQKYPEKTVLAGYAGYVLDWIIFNCQRALSLPEQRQLANQEIAASIQALDYVEGIATQPNNTL